MGQPQSKLSRLRNSRGNFKPANPLDDIGLPSKGDKRLLDPKTQEAYYTRIIEKHMAFCANAGSRDELLRRFSALEITQKTPLGPTTEDTPGLVHPAPHSVSIPSGDDNNGTVGEIAAALRKLREGIVASHRIDPFATQVYIFCIHFGVLTQHPPTYYPAILYAISRFQHTLTTIELKEITGYLVLDAACRRQNLAEAYELKTKHRLSDGEVDKVLSALSHDNFVTFRKLLGQIDGYKARIVGFADRDMVVMALKAFKAYMQVDLEHLERCAGRSWRQLVDDFSVGWKLEGGKVMIRVARSIGT